MNLQSWYDWLWSGSSSNKYTIKVANYSGATQHYALFANPSSVTRETGAFQTIIHQETCKPGESVDFSMNEEYVSVCGKSEGPLREGIGTKVLASQPLKLGHCAVMEMENGKLVFTPAQSRAGSDDIMEIKLGNFNRPSVRKDNIFVGYGVVTADGEVKSVAVTTPFPETTIKFSGTRKYALSVAEFKTGDIVDEWYASVVTEIDLSSLSAVYITHEKHGRLNVEYR